MLDPARLMERKEYYSGLLPWISKWGYNILHLHITDNQGCALVFPSRPELASANAFTVREMRQFIETARDYGIEVIPEIEGLGHTGFITNVKGYKHLGPRTRVGGFAAIDPEHPKTRDVFEDLIRDAADIFDSEIIHLGLDETDLGVLPRYRKTPADKHWEIFADHAAWLHERVRSCGKRPAMWGDHILHAPQIADRFGRDVLMYDWHYGELPHHRTLEFFIDKGFEVWGVPASLCYFARILPNAQNLNNLRNFSAHGARLRCERLTGMVNSIWAPRRYLPGAIDWPMALGGHLFSTEREDPALCKRFCADFYGLKGQDAALCADLMHRAYAMAPDRWLQDAIVHGESRRTGLFSREDARKAGVIRREFGTIAGGLTPLVKEAGRNAARLNDLVLSARILERIGHMGELERDKKRLRSGKGLRERVAKAWLRGRRGTPTGTLMEALEATL